MAGGMSSRGHRLSLAERSGVYATKRPSGPRHCWVIGEGGERHPGLLLEWRRQSGRWQGLVTFVQTDSVGTFTLIQSWLDGDHLLDAGR